MLFDKLFNRLVGRSRRSKHQQHEESAPVRNGEEMGQEKSGFFKGANNLVVKDSTFVESRIQNIQNFIAGNPGADPALKQIAEYADLDATMDSSARYPPPLCHPGTRLKIGDKLFSWLINPDREWDMQWLHGPAGTGKSAVAQTFAERCDGIGRLGASFFFSRLYDRNNPNTVVPSLVYQLAVCNSEYKSLVAAQLANDPELLRRKTRRTQFTKLIVEPFSFLKTQGHRSVQEPFLVVLDGLDECKGESAQREIIEMINEVVRLKKGFPLVWLICSRPEEYLKCIFSKADFTVNCGREELAVDAESIADVDFYLRDGLAGIRADFRYVTDPTWPPEEQIATLSGRASGHFGFASISLRYISDPAIAAPTIQLDTLLSFISGVKTGTSSPLEALDALYTGILRDVPDGALQTIQLVLGYKLYGDDYGGYFGSAQKICNFLSISQLTFYNAFRKLHSVVNVPSPEAAAEMGLKFYHLSFSDYLKNPDRSGEFSIEMQHAGLRYAKACLSWYRIDLELFHIADGPVFNEGHEHGVLPGLKWTSDTSKEEISQSFAKEVTYMCWVIVCGDIEWDEALLSQIRNFDFRYIRTNDLLEDWRNFVGKLWRNCSDGFIRTEPQSEADLKLLEYMESMIGAIWKTQPATFPLNSNILLQGGNYFFLGRSSKAVVCWTTGLRYPKSSFGLLNCDKAPSEKQISDYHKYIDHGRGGSPAGAKGNGTGE